MKIVLDTNVLLCGLMSPRGVSGRIVAAWIDHRFDVVLSLQQLAEIGRVLAQPKIRSRLGWDEAQIEQFIKQLFVRAEVVELESMPIETRRHPGNAPIMAARVTARADLLVTGDFDLLALRSQYPIEIPAEFARRL